MRPGEKVKGKAKKISFGGLMLFCKVLPFSSAIFALPNWNAFLKYSGLGGLGLFVEGTRARGQGGRRKWRAGLGITPEARLCSLLLEGSHRGSKKERDRETDGGKSMGGRRQVTSLVAFLHG